MVLDTNAAFDLMLNGSLLKASVMGYESAWGPWFWPVLFMATVGLVGIKSKSPALIAIMTIIRNVILGYKYALLPVQSSIIFYVVLVLTFGFTIYSVFGSTPSD